jgi:hypothetical protein
MLVLFASFSFWVSKTDDIKPKVELLSPVDATEIVRGNSIKVCAVLSDNLALESYRVKIIKGGTKSLRFVESFTCNHLTNSQLDEHGKHIPIIEGEKNVNLSFNIGVEEDAVPGDYYFLLLVNDKAGNEQMIKRYFTVVRY